VPHVAVLPLAVVVPPIAFVLPRRRAARRPAAHCRCRAARRRRCAARRCGAP
jgi:hypothetical protein